MNILCVWFGEAFGPEYLDWIKSRTEKAVKRHKLRFSVLTDRADVPEGWNAIAFENTFPSKLKKLEIFRPDIFPGEPVLYTDLDNTVVGPLDDILDRGFTDPLALGVRRNFNENAATSDCQTSLMMFHGGAHSYLYKQASARHGAGFLTDDYPIGLGRGDQLFVSERGERKYDLEERFPGAFVSYSWQWARGTKDQRAAARVIYHHGKRSKPHYIGWLKTGVCFDT